MSGKWEYVRPSCRLTIKKEEQGLLAENVEPLAEQDDRLLLAEVYRRDYSRMMAVAMQILSSHSRAEDAVHEVFLRYLHAHVPFRDENHLKAWLIRVTVNHCHDVARRRAVRAVLPLDEVENLVSGGDAEEAVLLSETMRQIADIPEKYRSAIVLRYLEDLSVEETAKALGISVSAAKMRLSRGREILKRKAGGDGNV